MTTTQIKLWLQNHQEYYQEIRPIISQRCEHCLDKKPIQCIRKTYKEEFEFDEFYSRQKVLVDYLETNDSLQELVDDYDQLDLSDEIVVQKWVIRLYETWMENFVNGDVHKMFVKDEVGNVVGFKVLWSDKYDENPYVVSSNGYENLVRFGELYLKYIESKSITLLPEHLILDSINFN